MTQNKFHPGDRVVDRDDNSDGDQMVVLDPNVGRASEVEIEDLNATVADLNEAYPPNDTVVTVVFVSWLESHVPGWREWDNKRLFSRTLNEYAEKWGVSLQTYDYPESRLEPPVDRGAGSDDGGGDPIASARNESRAAFAERRGPNKQSNPTLTGGSMAGLSAEGVLVAASHY